MAYRYQYLSAVIVGGYYRVYRELNATGDDLYTITRICTRLAHNLRQNGLGVLERVSVPQMCGGRQIGVCHVDLVVEGLIAVSVKNRCCRAEHIYALRTFLYSSGLPVGILLQLGGERPDFRRVQNSGKLVDTEWR